MIITISSLYCEPGYSFEISHKVDLLIREKIKEMIVVPYELDKVNPKATLNLIVSTNSKTLTVDVKGNIVNRKSGFINWGLWLPYHEIVEAPNQLLAYTRYLFDAIVVLLNKYNIKEDDVRKVQAVIESTVVNNSEYKYVEKELPMLDLSDLDL